MDLGSASGGYALLDFLFGPVDPSGTGTRFPRKGVLPDVRGMPLDEARRTLAREGFKADVVPLEPRPAAVMGTVVEQTPPPGTRWVRARRLSLEVWHPPAPTPPPSGRGDASATVLSWRKRRGTRRPSRGRHPD